ncbi:MAG: hypothetical protein GXP54_11330 [Deltaproteobacteria bacterium]|nr:hypothetical protein [Deltaproteobacteria bacterium]
MKAHVATTILIISVALVSVTGCGGNVPAGGDAWMAGEVGEWENPGNGPEDKGPKVTTGPWNQPDFDAGIPTGAGSVTAALKTASTCDDIIDQWKLAAIEEMTQLMQAAWYSAKNWSFPCPTGHPDYGSVYDSVAAYDASSPSDPGGATEYSTTNVQVVGVDEADYLKNDGKWIYILADKRLQILDVWPPEQAHVLSSTPIEGNPIAMFVDKDVAVVYSSVGIYQGGFMYQQCTYGYDCEFTGDGNDTQITVYDIKDRSNPVKTREIQITGSYLTSRRINDFVYSVIYFRDPVVLPPGLVKTAPDSVVSAMSHARCGEQLGLHGPDVKAEFEALFQENVAKIMHADMMSWIPSVKDTWYMEGGPHTLSNPLADCEGYLLSGTNDGMSLLSLLSFDMTAQESMAATTIRSKPGAVYSSKQALYLAMRHQKKYGMEWFDGMQEDPEATTVHKFLLSAEQPATKYQASGVVKGRVLNQFSMSERDGRLQIATTSGHLPGPTDNAVAVMEPDGDELKVVGMLSGLAPGEDIRSVRFGGDLAYIVTFKKTDPLFVIDMSDPTAPVVKGELKIPGYSTYMHFMDSTHLLTIGFDADDTGSFAWFQGIMLQVFDVTEITDPKLQHKEIIGTRGTASEAATNHLAFNYFKPKDLLAIPMIVCEESSGGSDYGDKMTFNGLMVYRVTVNDGFEYQGGIPHAVMDQSGYYGQACGQWWSGSTSTVKRSIFMDDYAVSVAMDVIKFSSLDNLENPVASVSLE